VTGDRGLVLLPGVKDDPSSWAPVRAALSRSFRLLIVSPTDLAASAAGPFDLGQAAERAGAAIQEAGLGSAAVLGVGLGAMVALQLAGDQPQRVSGLALVTRQVALSPTLMSLPAVVSRLLPARAVQRLGAGPDQVVALLDQVRIVDAQPLAARITVPTAVLVGDRDRLNRRASSALARAVPHAELLAIPGAAQDWTTSSPELVSDVLVSLFG
jgi:3-oxoadipate enol-lactonase